MSSFDPLVKLEALDNLPSNWLPKCKTILAPTLPTVMSFDRSGDAEACSDSFSIAAGRLIPFVWLLTLAHTILSATEAELHILR